MNSYDNGGLNFLDFYTLNNAFKINWLKQFLKNPFSIWNFTPNFIFSKLGGLNFFLLCNYNIEKIPSKLSYFHKQMLLSWSLIYKHNFSPHRYYIWNNKDIVYRNKSLFYPHWFTQNILLVLQLFNPDGSLMTYQEFNSKYNIIVPLNEFNTVIKAIPNGVIMLLKSTAGHNLTLLPIDPTKLEIGQICFSSTRNSNRSIRKLFQKDVVSIPYVVSYWNFFFNNLDWKKIWNLPARYLINNKAKEVSFKIIHRVYPSKVFFTKI